MNKEKVTLNKLNRIERGTLLMILLTATHIFTVYSQVVEPAEPIQLRGLPRPSDLPLESGPFKGNWDSIAANFVCPEWFFDAKELSINKVYKLGEIM